MQTAAAIELLLQLINASGPVSAAIRKAVSEGRRLSKTEMDAAFDQDDAARDALVAAVAQREG